MKKYCFQYATVKGEVIENTDLITLEEAETLWAKYYSDAARKIELGIGVNMYIWKNMEHDCDFRETLITIENDFESDGQFIFRPVQKVPSLLSY